MQTNDEGLLKQIAETSAEALGLLYDRYGRLVYGLALHMLSDPAAAEEVTQDVFVQVWHKAATYRPEQGKVITWLASVARNRAIDTLRRQGARPEGHRQELEEEAFFELQDNSPAVEPSIELRQQRERVRHALAALPPEQREPLLLAYFEGQTQEQIATRLGQPLGTVKTRMRSGLHHLRALLDEPPGARPAGSRPNVEKRPGIEPDNWPGTST